MNHCDDCFWFGKCVTDDTEDCDYFTPFEFDRPDPRVVDKGIYYSEWISMLEELADE